MFKFIRLFSKPSYYDAYKSFALEIHTTGCVLAGHSKWANIKHTKELKDRQRAAQFARLSRSIRLAVQEGGGSANPDLNSRLKVAVEEALKRNMPNGTIQGVLKKCSGQNLKLEKYLLEIRHAFKVFMIVVLYTDNFTQDRMTLAGLIRKSSSSYFDTSHMFFDKGIVEVVGNDTFVAKTSEELEEIATEHAIECGAEELEIIDTATKHLTFICEPQEMQRVKQKLSALGYNVEGVEHVFIPNSPITLSQAELDAYEKFKDRLKAFGGVDAIYDNVNIED